MNIPDYIQAFEKLAYGLFLHWGLYSQIGRGEWIMYHENMPSEDYERWMRSFTAEDFDARAWVRLAKEAGMRYACLTTRHHEGFSLYDTRGLSTFDAPHSPAGRDLVAEFVEACREEGVVPFLYHTTLDWRMNSHTCDAAAFHDYIDYLIASVDVLCTHYGELGGLWFDGNWSRHDVDWRQDELYGAIRRKQPKAIIVNNAGLSMRGKLGHPELDVSTFEQGLPTAPDRSGYEKYFAGEMCQTLQRHWGCCVDDFNYKSIPELIRTLCSCRKVGANYLLNVGPTPQGGIPELEAAMLRRMGKWVERHAHLIHEGKPVDVRCHGDDFVLEWGGKFYYFAHHLPRRGSQHVVVNQSGEGPRVIQGLKRPIWSIHWLDNEESVNFVHDADLGLTTVQATGYPYGADWVVRVAEMS